MTVTHEREHVSVEAEAARVDFTDAVCESEQIAANNRGVSPRCPVRFADDVMFLIGQPASRRRGISRSAFLVVTACS